MKLYGVYQVTSGGSATKNESYKLVGIFLDKERAEYMASNLIRDHEWFHGEVDEIFIPDEAIAMMFKAAIENMERNNDSN